MVILMPTEQVILMIESQRQGTYFCSVVGQSHGKARTAESEYVAMASAAQESVWLRQLIMELTDSSLMYEDNQSAIAMTKNPQFHGRAKHISIKHHFVREQVTQGTQILSKY